MGAFRAGPGAAAAQALKPLSQPLPYADDPLALFAPLADCEGAVLLHSADRSTRFGRFDIMSAEPVETVAAAAAADVTQGLPCDLSHRVRARYGAPDSNDQEVPFRFGFLGVLGYPLHTGLERQRPAPPSPDTLPDLWGGLYDWSIVTDHRARQTHLYARDAAANQRARALLQREPRRPAAFDLGQFRSSMPPGHYQAAFAQILDYIRAGDCYQVNFARHYQASLHGDPFDLYCHWLRSQPAPFSAYLRHSADAAVLCLSPERFLKRQGNRVATCPIKGTRPRRQRAPQDALAQLALLRSAKDRAENLMIVDLLRNDLGRRARTGSVQVAHLCEPVAFANVHHLVSTIDAQLPPQVSTGELLAAMFPCGSVTGAPKIRAMDIINELEPIGRSVYCGAIGYLDASGDCDFNVAIRTATVDRGQVNLWGGGGIVADSQPASERAEIDSKIGRLLNQR
ncbi:MAG: aminodeoxychorismate synthase component I [Pseudomonadota bacterium]